MAERKGYEPHWSGAFQDRPFRVVRDPVAFRGDGEKKPEKSVKPVPQYSAEQIDGWTKRLVRRLLEHEGFDIQQFALARMSLDQALPMVKDIDDKQKEAQRDRIIRGAVYQAFGELSNSVRPKAEVAMRNSLDAVIEIALEPGTEILIIQEQEELLAKKF